MTHRQRLALLTTIVGSSIVILDGSVVNLALPAMGRELGASFADLQWVIDSYLLSLSALILLGGSLGDIFGKKRVYIIGLLGFGVASLLCGVAPTIELLLAMRVLQGICGALLVPGALALINTNFPSNLRGPAISRWAAWSSITPALAPLLGGYLVDHVSWRWIFFLNVPLVIICVVLARISLRQDLGAKGRHVDVAGASIGVLALAGLTYGLIEGPVQQWRGWATPAFIAGLLAVGVFLVVEARRKDPLIKFDLFRSRNFSVINGATFAIYGALSGFFFALTIYLQTRLGYPSLVAGLTALPAILPLLFFSSRVGQWASRLGPRPFLTAGPLIVAVGMFSLVGLAPGANYFLTILPAVFLFGCGMTLTVSPLTITVMSSVPARESGIASGINNAISRIAGLLVIAALGLLGSGNSFVFTIWLCSTLVASAGITSYLLLTKQPVPVTDITE